MAFGGVSGMVSSAGLFHELHQDTTGSFGMHEGDRRAVGALAGHLVDHAHAARQQFLNGRGTVLDLPSEVVQPPAGLL